MGVTKKLSWKNASKENPGFTVYWASPERDPGLQYVIRRKRPTPDFTPTGWRVFARDTPAAPLRTIFHADTLQEAKAFVQDWEELHARAANTEG